VGSESEPAEAARRAGRYEALTSGLRVNEATTNEGSVTALPDRAQP
jgi:hypothetical protein